MKFEFPLEPIRNGQELVNGERIITIKQTSALTEMRMKYSLRFKQLQNNLKHFWGRVIYQRLDPFRHL